MVKNKPVNILRRIISDGVICETLILAVIFFLQKRLFIV
jgi:hypothetical protein